MYDAIWYLPQCRSKVLPLLRIPPLEERTRRGIIGLVWGPGQPKPLKDAVGPALGFSWVHGNFYGYEKDPDKFLAFCDLTEIEPGLIGGTFKEGATDAFKDRAAFEQSADEARIAAQAKPVSADGPSVEMQTQQAHIQLLLTVARLAGARKPEKMSIDALREIYALAIIRGLVDEDTYDQWISTFVQQPEPTPEELPPITLEQLGDEWEQIYIDRWRKSENRTTITKPIQRGAA